METVEGFYFESEKQAARAQKEADGIKYIKENTKMDDPEVVLKLYNKLIQDEMLSTPVGMAFLVELQELLLIPDTHESQLWQAETSRYLSRLKSSLESWKMF